MGGVYFPGGRLATHVDRDKSSPQFNRVAERATCLNMTTEVAGRIQVRARFPGLYLPSTKSLWAKASCVACDALNRTATSANEADKSPYEMWCGETPSVVLQPFFKLSYCKLKS